jgi:hypothetical protein
MNKYCDYHQDHGHETEDCVSLRIEIERMIKRGKLARFVAANQHTKYDKPQVEQRYHDEGSDLRRPSSVLPLPLDAEGVRMITQPIVKQDAAEPIAKQDAMTTAISANERSLKGEGTHWEIHTIVGGFTAGGSSSSGRRAYARRLPSKEVLSLERPQRHVEQSQRS